MRIFDTNVQKLKYKVLQEVARHAYAGTPSRTPIWTSPRPSPPAQEPPCAAASTRSAPSSAERVKLAMGGDRDNPNVIEVIDIACDECPVSGYRVRPGLPRLSSRTAAPAPARAARSPLTDTHHAHIDPDKCVECGRCASVCPYSAISDRRRPCERACKVKAIQHGRTQDGPHRRGEVHLLRRVRLPVPLRRAIRTSPSSWTPSTCCATATDNQKYQVYAVVAPSISSQFRYAKLGQVITRHQAAGLLQRGGGGAGRGHGRLARGAGAGRKGLPHQSLLPGLRAATCENRASPAQDHFSATTFRPWPTIAQVSSRAPTRTRKIIFIGPCTAKKQEFQREEVRP